ncbi:MAG: sulfite exporter TauE/SafE family protein [Dehalococcoidia bacterium]
MSLEMTLYVSGVTWLAASLQGVTGVGFMILSVPGLILVLPAQVVVPGLILLYLPLGVIQVLQLRGDVDWWRLFSMVGSAVIGLPLGALILTETDSETMQQWIGGIMVGMALLLQVKPGKPLRREGIAWVGVGLISGVLAASTSLSGPPVVVLALKQRWEAGRFRATLLAYFVSLSLGCLPFYWEMDLLNRASVELVISGLPGVALGYVTGGWLRRRVSTKGFRWVALGVVIGGGLAVVIL